MAIYHFNVKIIHRTQRNPDGTRSAPRSVVAKLAYRAGTKLTDHQTGQTWDFSNKSEVAHTEISLPAGAPAFLKDLERFGNEIEKSEKRIDAQLARHIEIGLPVELDLDQQIKLVRDYVERELVSRGMCAAWAIHLDNQHNPHAHITMTMRKLLPEQERAQAEAEGKPAVFSEDKAREWNTLSQLLSWRRTWAETTNHHLAQAGLAVRIDHRSYKDQNLALTPGRKLGVGRDRQQDSALPGFIKGRLEAQHEICRLNGEKILANPSVALDAITHMEATFTHQDLARWLHTHTEGAEQFTAAYLKLTTSKELVPLGTDDQGRVRFTTKAMIQTEHDLLARSQSMAGRVGHAVKESRQQEVLQRHHLSEKQGQAYQHLLSSKDLVALVGIAGSGKSTLLAAAREAWESQGFKVKGAALAGIAAENLQGAAGIQSRTLASLEHEWDSGREKLSAKDILVIDEAGMVGTRQLARVMARADKAGAKVVLIGDHQQLQAIEAGAGFRAVTSQIGFRELREVWRQNSAWQREATQLFAQGKTQEALTLYESHGNLTQVETHVQARAAVLARWAQGRKAAPIESHLMMAYTNEDVLHLNTLARQLRIQQGEIGKGQPLQTSQGKREFSVGDRIYFRRKEKSLGVQNGSLGTIESIDKGVFKVKLDGKEGTTVNVDTRFYTDLEHGYAATVSRNQGSTFDHAYLLATEHLDRHAIYVAMTRHRRNVHLFYARESFGVKKTAVDALHEAEEKARSNMLERLSRERPKELVHDYLDLQTQLPDAPRTLADRFQAGVAKGKGLAIKNPSKPGTHGHNEQASNTLVARFSLAVESSRTATLERWQNTLTKEASLETERAREAESNAKRQQRSSDKDYGR